MKPALLLLLLGGCAMMPARAPAPVPLTPEQQACRTESRGADEARELRRSWAPGVNDTTLLPQIQAAEERAYRACLRARRLPGPSGVEAPR